MFCVWFTVSDWKRASKLTRSIHVLLLGSVWLLWSLIGIELARHKVGRDNFVVFCQTLSAVLGGSYVAFKGFENWRHRERMTTLVETINEKVKQFRVVASPLRNKERNRLYLILTWVMLYSLCPMFSFILFIGGHTIATGKLYFTMALPVADPPYGLVWWCEVALVEIVIIFGTISYTLTDALLIDTALQLAFLFRVQYDQLLKLSPIDFDLGQKMLAIVEELEDLKK